MRRMGFKRQCRQHGSLTLHEDLTSTALLAWSLSLLQTQSARNRRYPHCALRTLRAKGTWYLQMTFLSQASSLRDGLSTQRTFSRRSPTTWSSVWGPPTPSPREGQGQSPTWPRGNLPERTSVLSSGQWLCGGRAGGEPLGFINLQLSPGLENTTNLTDACGVIVSAPIAPNCFLLLPGRVTAVWTSRR